MKQCRKFLLYFDYYDYFFREEIYKSKHHKSMIGSIIGLLSSIIILAYSSYLSISFFNGEDSMTIVTQRDTSKIPVNNLTNYPLLFSVVDTWGNTIPSEGLFSFTLQYRSFSHEVDSSGRSSLKGSQINIPTKTCSMSDLGEYNYLITNVAGNILNNSQCFVPGSHNLTLHGRYGDASNGFSTIVIVMNKCESSKQTCYNDTYAKTVLNGAYFALNYISSDINNYNSQPNSPKLQTSVLPISPFIRKKFYYYFDEVIFDTDNGLILNNHDVKDFYQFNYFDLDVDLNDMAPTTGSAYWSLISLRNSNQVLLFYRKYSKLQDLLAKISGIISSILFFSKYLVSFLSHDLLYLNLSNKIFEFDENCDEDKKNKIEINRQVEIKPIQLPNTIIDNKKSAANTNENNTFKISCIQLKMNKFCSKKNVKNISDFLIIKKFIKSHMSVLYMTKQINFFKHSIASLNSNLVFNPKNWIIPFHEVSSKIIDQRKSNSPEKLDNSDLPLNTIVPNKIIIRNDNKKDGIANTPLKLKI